MRRTVIHEVYYEIPEDATPQVRWLLNLMNEYGLTMASLAEKIHVTRASVGLWINKSTPITFGNICAICYAVDKHADPEKLYELFNKEAK